MFALGIASLLAWVSCVAACSQKLEFSARNVSSIVLNSTYFPMQMIVANEPWRARTSGYSCYVMHANFTITFSDSTGNTSYLLKPNSNKVVGETYELSYTPTKEHMMAATKDATTMTLRVQALYDNFVMWEGCDDGWTRNFLFMKAGVDASTISYRCLQTAILQKFYVDTVPKGLCY